VIGVGFPSWCGAWPNQRWLWGI